MALKTKLALPLVLSFSLIAAPVSASATSAADDVLPDDAWRVFTPTTPWQVSTDGESCAMVRGFKSGPRRGQAEIRRYSPDEVFELSVFVSEADLERNKLSFRFSPETEWHSGLPMFARSAQYGGFITNAHFDLPLEERDEEPDDQPAPGDEDYERVPVDPYKRAAMEKKATGIWVRTGLGEPVLLKTGTMLGPMMQLRDCTDALLESWGYDAASYHAQKRHTAMRDGYKWIPYVQQHYPGQALRSGNNGLIRVRLAIDTEGRVTDCHPQSNLSGKEFYDAACGVLKRQGRFYPAHDASGTPVASFYSLAISYQLN
ncbi:energy transducer TonB [Paraurantiacibacter namhicola]|uniref:Gram-negative bacterial tonB protein n=1 Tax=Paraurantiacibacter namhicola TaxID=645517 RepID=A0A1C7D5V2_9SPHN|nr:energy transducer TonB [Paraurantiacibacter namhicola]ANU06683.1 Gram-negative bacterial tonB protein [Paraurantiacibacter namhicola]